MRMCQQQHRDIPAQADAHRRSAKAHTCHIRLAVKQVEENCRHTGMFLEGMSLSSFAPSVCNRWRQRLRVARGFVFLCHRAHSLLGASSFAVHSASSFTIFLHHLTIFAVVIRRRESFVELLLHLGMWSLSLKI